MLVESPVDVGENAFCDGLACRKIVVTVGEDFRFHNRHEASLLADRRVPKTQEENK